jgi:hypothetical protein
MASEDIKCGILTLSPRGRPSDGSIRLYTRDLQRKRLKTQLEPVREGLPHVGWLLFVPGGAHRLVISGKDVTADGRVDIGHLGRMQMSQIARSARERAPQLRPSFHSLRGTLIFVPGGEHHHINCKKVMSLGVRMDIGHL